MIFMSGKIYNLNEIEIKDGKVADIVNSNMSVWNVHYQLRTKQGYTYKNIVEVTKNEQRRFIHLDDRESLEIIISVCQIHNKIINYEGKNT